jgi:hypothetical protein
LDGPVFVANERQAYREVTDACLLLVSISYIVHGLVLHKALDGLQPADVVLGIISVLIQSWTVGCAHLLLLVLAVRDDELGCVSSVASPRWNLPSVELAYQARRRLPAPRGRRQTPPARRRPDAHTLSYCQHRLDFRSLRFKFRHRDTHVGPCTCSSSASHPPPLPPRQRRSRTSPHW